MEEEKSQHSGENLNPANIPRRPTSKPSNSKVATSKNHDRRRREGQDSQASLSSSSLSSEYNLPRQNFSTQQSTEVTVKNVDINERNKPFGKNKTIHTDLLDPTKLSGLSVARQCLNSVTDLSTDEISMNGNVSENNKGDEILSQCQNTINTDMQTKHIKAENASETIETEKSAAMSMSSTNNSARKNFDGDLSLASVSLGSALQPLPSSEPPSTAFTLSGE